MTDQNNGEERLVLKLLIFFPTVLCTLLGFGKACGPSEYKSAVGECCPMCNIASQKNARRTSSSVNVDGSVVLSDCSGDLSTTCKPCAPGTFISEPNGLHKCFICKTCAEGIWTSDTVCVDCPPGFYSPSGLNCTKWTDCTARNEIEAENGSSVKDVTCSTKSQERYGLIIAVVLTSFFGIILYLVSQITLSC